MKILGISAYYHDSAATLIVDGKIVSAYQEERLTRIKHDSSFPSNAISACLRDNELIASDIDHVIFFEKPFIKFERILETYLAFAPRGFKSFSKAIPVWLDEKLFQKSLISKELINLNFTKNVAKNIFFSDHHLSHAASAFYPSPFEEAVVLTMDGVGEWATSSICIGKGKDLTKISEMHFPHSLGLLYSAFTYHCGFKVNSGEYKLMGLAPYGNPIFSETIKTHLVEIYDDGSFKLNLDYFDYCTGLTMTNEKFNELFSFSQRSPEEELKQIHMDLAASIQVVTEEIVLKIARHLKHTYKLDNLCLAGGVALNCVANGKIYKENIFKNIWIQPAAGDAGGSLGAALALYHNHFKNKRIISVGDSMNGAYLGSSYTHIEIEDFLKQSKASYSLMREEDLMDTVADALSKGAAVGWFQGRMEFGPRSLGNRSILANPEIIETQKNLNLKIKFRESFRPFAPAVLEEDVDKYFDYDNTSPYMLMVANVQDEIKTKANSDHLFGIERLNIPKSSIPAVTHIDYSARLQTISKKTNTKFHALVTKFKEKTKCSVVVNTSFNIRGEPIVCSPKDAFNCFMGTDLDMLVLENFILFKKDQPENLKHDYKNEFHLD